MKKPRVPYSYCILRYVHDPSVGEALNVGVLAFAPGERWLQCRIEQRYSRLSATLREFNGHHYRAATRRMLSAVEAMQARMRDALPAVDDVPKTLDHLFRFLFPDPGLSLQRGETFSGLAGDLDAAITDIFERMVSSQHPEGPDVRRNDSQVWAAFEGPFEKAGLLEMLQPKRFISPAFSIEFDYAWKNAEWHVLQPLSMDYRHGDSLQKAATIWLGNATALKDQEELGELDILLGPPQSSAMRLAYARAKDLLRKMPVPYRLIEEDEAADFANEVASMIKEHQGEPVDRTR
jgi:Protein of unknown function (DUF3037)